jgi:hypothetical protein
MRKHLSEKFTFKGFIRILPERRENLKRVTEKSIMDWVKKFLGDYEDIKNIYFVQVKI